MITPSPEVAAVIRRWNRAMAASDGPTLQAMLSRSDHLLCQGTADGKDRRG